jgi:sec-independent protein translocase protein TatC
MWDIETLIAQITMTAMLLGTLFQFPLVISLLVRAQVLSRALLIEYRRVAHASILIIVALLPPTDGLTLILMVFPLAAMYELTILLSYSSLVGAPHATRATLNNGHY